MINTEYQRSSSWAIDYCGTQYAALFIIVLHFCHCLLLALDYFLLLLLNWKKWFLLFFIALYYFSLFLTILHCVMQSIKLFFSLHSILLSSNVHCTKLFCTVMYRVLHCIKLFCTVFTVFLFYSCLHCIVLSSTVHCIKLHLAAPIEQHEKRLCIAPCTLHSLNQLQWRNLTFSVLLHLAMFFYLHRAIFLLASCNVFICTVQSFYWHLLAP